MNCANLPRQGISFHQKIPFHHSLPADQSAKMLMVANFIDEDGVITEKGKTCIDPSQFELDAEIIDAIDNQFKKSFPINGRCKAIPMEISTSVKECALNVDRVAQDELNCELEVLSLGGKLIRLAKKKLQDIFISWATKAEINDAQQLITSIFKELIESDANDNDWHFRLRKLQESENQKINTKKACASIIEKGIVSPLGDKFKMTMKDKMITPFNLYVQIAKKKESVEKHPNPYLAELFKKPIPSEGDARLVDYFMETFTFTSAADVQNDRVAFSLRCLGINDLFFPRRLKPTPTAHNSLFANITPLLNNTSPSKIRLESFLGKDPVHVMQAIVDMVISNYTNEDHLEIDRFGFAQTISHLSQGGRRYKKDWFKNCLHSLKSEAIKEKIPFPQFLSNQLISRNVDRHQGSFSMLIVQAFNASAILLWLDECHLKDIQELWKRIFGHIDVIEKNKCIKQNSLVENMTILMRDPNFNFKDLYAKLIVSATLKEHSVQASKGQYQCKITQSNKELFYQIEIPSSKNDQSFNVCTLMFPCELSRAIKHLGDIANTSPVTLDYLRHIQNTITDKIELSYSFDQSELQAFNTDPRIDLSQCANASLKLMNIRQEVIWQTGFLLCLAFQAQKKHDPFLMHLLGKMIHMLIENWASKKFKDQTISTFEETLCQSGISHPLSKFKDFTKMEVVRWLFSIGEEPFLTQAWLYHEDISEEKNYDDNVAFFHTLLEDCIAAQKLLPLQSLIQHLSLDSIFLPETIVNWISHLYQVKSVVGHPELEKVLFFTLLRTLQKMKHLKIDSGLLKSLILDISNSKARLENAQEFIAFGQEVIRLKIFTDLNLNNSFTNTVNLADQLVKKHNDPTTTYIPLDDKPKAAIENHLRKLPIDSYYSTKDKKSLFLLLEKQAKLQLGSENRIFFFKALKIIGECKLVFSQQEISSLIKLFHQQQLPTIELLDYYLSENSPLLMPTFIELILSIINNSTFDYSSPHCTQSVNYLLTTTDISTENKFLRKSCVSKFLHKLRERNLFDEALKIFIAMQKASVSIKDSEILIQVCTKAIAFEQPPMESIAEMVSEIAVEKISDIHTKEQLLSLYKNLYDYSMQKKEFLKSMHWLTKQMQISKTFDNDFYEKSLRLIRQLIMQDLTREAGELIAKIDPPEVFNVEWLKICKMLMQKGCIASCRGFFDNKRAMKSVNWPEIKQEWTAILTEMLQQAKKLVEANDKTSRVQLDFLCHNAYNLIFENQPSDDQLWVSFVDVAVKGGPIHEVEKIFSTLLHKSPEILDGQLKINLISKLLKRLAKDGSNLFKSVNEWWPKVWANLPISKYEKKWAEVQNRSTERSSGSNSTRFRETLSMLSHRVYHQGLKILKYEVQPSEDERCMKNKLKLLCCLINGGDKYLELHSSSLDLKDCRLLSQKIVNIIHDKSMRIYQDFFSSDIQCINLINIYMRTQSDLDKTNAQYLLVDKFFYTNPNPIDEKIVIDIFNRHVKELNQSNSKQIEDAMFTLLSAALQSDHSNELDLFSLLDYCKKHYPYDKENKLTQHVKNELKIKKNHDKEIVFQIENSICNYVPLIIKIIRILLENPIKTSMGLTRKQELVTWAFERVKILATPKTKHFLEWSLNHEKTPLYLSKVSLHHLKMMKDRMSSNLFHVVHDYVRDTESCVKKAIERRDIMQSHGMGHRFKLLKEEKWSLTCIVSTWLILIGIGFKISMIFYNNFPSNRQV